MQLPKTTRLHPLAAAVILASSALPSYAEQLNEQTQASEHIEESILVEGTRTSREVSSPKFTAPLLDSPQTVSVIPQKVFNQQGAQSLTDVLKNTPGISFNAGENGFASTTNNFQLRGFDTSGSIFVNGIRDSGNQTRDIFNLEQVEIAKGAASENGRSGASGYINMVTKAPQLDVFNQATISYGSDEYDSKARLRATLDSNHQLSDGIALRVNVMAQEGGMPGREHAEQRAMGFAPSVAFGLDSNTRVVLGYQYTEHNDKPDFGVPAGFIKDLTVYDSASDSLQNVYDPAFKKRDRDTYYGLDSDWDDSRSHLFTANIEHDINSAITISNQLGWADNTRDAGYSVIMPSCATATQKGCTAVTPAGMARTSQLFYDRHNTTLSNLSSLTARFETGAVQHTVSSGIEISREVSRANRFASRGLNDTDIYNPDPSRDSAIKPVATEKNKVHVDTIAAYIYDTLQFNEQWQLTGGVRVERYKVDIDDKSVAGVPGPMDDYQVSDTTYSGKLGVVYKPLKNGSIYISTAVASLPPGSWLSNPDISRGGNSAFPGSAGHANNKAKTQRSINYEIGTKWEFYDKRLITTAAVFQTERRNVGVVGRSLAEAQASPQVDSSLKGYSKQVVSGIELGASGQITQHWDVFAGLAYMDSERKMSSSLDQQYCYGAKAAADLGDCATYSINGDQLAYTPKLTANLWTSYTLPFGLTIGGGAQYVDDVFIGRPDDADRIIPNDHSGKMPSYTVFNAFASYAVSEDFTVRLNINNVADKLYAKSVNWSGKRVDLGESRSWQLSANFNF